LNQYAYAGNNPFVYHDADGAFPKRVKISFSPDELRREPPPPHQYINMSGVYKATCAECDPIERGIYYYNITSWLPPFNVVKGPELTGRFNVYLEEDVGLPVTHFWYSMEAGMGPTPIPDEAIPMMMLGSMRAVKYLKSEVHHPITYKIWLALERHLTLAGKFKYKDPRYEFASNPGRHRGYCDLLHRSIEKEMIPWLKEYPEATPQEFLNKMNKSYSRKEIREAGPNVKMRWKEPQE
jgi:hypothetical protein